MIKQYFYISLFIYVTINTSFVLTDPVPSVNSGTSNQTHTPDNKLNSTKNGTNFILTEGGKIELPQNISHQGREHVHVVVSSSTKTDNFTTSPQHSSVPTKSATTAITPSTKATNEKPITEPSTSSDSKIAKNDTSVTTPSTKATELKPVTEPELEFHGDSKVKPRKGVSLNDSVVDEHKISSTVGTKLNISSTVSSTKPSTNVTTTTSKPRKPTVTIGSDEEDPPSRLSNMKVFAGGKQINPKNQSSSTTSVLAVEDPVILGNRNIHAKGSDYVLPIVLTILAVPLLAIILTVVYKRGAEWWTHRHYRRMDFLIDGMYNN